MSPPSAHTCTQDSYIREHQKSIDFLETENVHTQKRLDKAEQFQEKIVWGINKLLITNLVSLATTLIVAYILRKW